MSETQKGPNGWAATIIGGLIAAAGVVLAVAIWQVSAGLSLGIIAVCFGIGARQALLGLGYVIYSVQSGRAELERARRELLANQTPPKLPFEKQVWD
jgi:hypothetical protein